MTLLRALALSLLLGTPGAAQTLPQWEVGAGVIGRYGAAFRGSGDYNTAVIPFPLVVYRGDILRLGGEQTAAIVPFETDRVSFGLSLAGSSGVQSEDNALRGGLPDLDRLFEVGPEIVIRGRPLALPGFAEGQLDVTLQTRAAVSVSFDEGLEYRGLVARPTLRYRVWDLWGENSRITAAVGPIFATEGVNDFYYEVEPGAAQPAFDAVGGYVGTEVNLGLRLPVTERLRLLAGVGAGYYGNAANADSPLIEEDFAWSGYLGLTYTFFQSEQQVPRR